MPREVIIKTKVEGGQKARDDIKQTGKTIEDLGKKVPESMKKSEAATKNYSKKVSNTSDVLSSKTPLWKKAMSVMAQPAKLAETNKELSKYGLSINRFGKFTNLATNRGIQSTTASKLYRDALMKEQSAMEKAREAAKAPEWAISNRKFLETGKLMRINEEYANRYGMVLKQNGKWQDAASGKTLTQKEAIDKYRTGVAKQRAAMEASKQKSDELTGSNDAMRESWTEMKKAGNIAEMNRQLSRAGLLMDVNGKYMDKQTGKQVKARTAVKRWTEANRKFDASLLSGMFLMMGIKNATMGLTDAAFQAVGVNEIWNAFMTTAFLPVALTVLKFIMSLWSWFNKLPKPVKQFITWGIFLVGILASIGLAIYALSLGLPALLGGLKWLFGLLPKGAALALKGLSGLIGGFVSWIGGILLAPFQAIWGFLVGIFNSIFGAGGIIAGGGIGAFLAIAAIVLLIIGLIFNLGKTIDTIVSFILNMVGYIGSFISGLISFIVGLVEVIIGFFVGIFTGNWSMLQEGWANLLAGLMTMLQAWIGAIVEVFLFPFKILFVAIEGIFIALDNIIPGIKSAFDGLVNYILGLLKGPIDLVSGFFNWLTGQKPPAIPETSAGVVGSMQAGGAVGETGTYLLHKGETVTPAEGGAGIVNFSPTVNITATMNSDTDVRAVAEKLNEYWYTDYKRLRI